MTFIDLINCPWILPPKCSTKCLYHQKKKRNSVMRKRHLLSIQVNVKVFYVFCFFSAQCWLKKQKDVLVPDRQEGGQKFMWTSGLIFGQGQVVSVDRKVDATMSFIRFTTSRSYLNCALSFLKTSTYSACFVWFCLPEWMIITVLCSSRFIRLYIQFVLSFLLICDDNSSAFLRIMTTKIVFGIILIKLSCFC